MSKQPKKLLVLGHVWPEPTASAAGSHMLSLIDMFQSNGYEIHFWCVAKLNENPEELEKLDIQTKAIEVNSDSFDIQVKDVMPDIVLFDRFITEEQFGWRVSQCCPEALKLLDTEDLHCLRHARQEALKKGTEVEYLLKTSDISKREIASIYRCDLTLILSKAELCILNDIFSVPNTLLAHSPFMIKAPQVKTLGFSERKHFVTIGNFLHAPNWDAVLYLRETLWPTIRKKLPEAQMHIYGAYAANKAYALNNKKIGFRILGRAESAYDVLTNAKVCLAPLRFGAGLKGKLTDAMLAGTPSVTTNIGAEGMMPDNWLENDWPGSITDQDDDFVDQAVRLYQDSILWQEKQLQGFDLLAKQFDAQTNSNRLMQSICGAIENKHQRRTDNFFGQLLNHHNHKSSEYMSRWIQTKNELKALREEN